MIKQTYESLNIFWITTIISLLLVISLILLIFACISFRNFIASLCLNKSRNQFQDFDNESGFFNDISIATIPPVEFAMYPPTVSAFDATTSAIYFEPLPDIISRYKSQRKSMGLTNDSKMRPTIWRLSLLGRQNSEDDYIDDEDDTAKLERIFERNISSFPRSQLQYIQEMGTTLSGKVLQGEAQNLLPGYRKSKVAVSLLKEDADVRMKVVFLNEVAAFREIDHINVLKLYHQCIDTVPLLNILEYCPMGNLKLYIQTQQSSIAELSNRDLLLSFACDMAAGLNALHQHNFVHRDFALRNCLVTQDLIVKVGDYGLSQSKHSEDYFVDTDDCYIPVRWMAPETIQFVDNNIVVHTISKEANTWSFGVSLWELFSLGELPYPNLTDIEVLQNVITTQKIRLQKPRFITKHLDQMYELMELCWPIIGTHRPSIRELRIMILHLKSSKNQLDNHAFEQKWNQLLPRENKENINFESMPSTDYSPTASLVPFAGSIQASNSTRRSDSPMTTFSEFNLGTEGPGVQTVALNNLSFAEELNMEGVKPFYESIRHDTDEDDFEVVSMSTSGDKDLDTDHADIFTKKPDNTPLPISNRLIVEVSKAAGEGSSSFGSPSMKSGDSFQIILTNEINNLVGDEYKNNSMNRGLPDKISNTDLTVDPLLKTIVNTEATYPNEKTISQNDAFDSTLNTILSSDNNVKGSNIEPIKQNENTQSKKKFFDDIKFTSDKTSIDDTRLMESILSQDSHNSVAAIEDDKILDGLNEIKNNVFSEGFQEESLLQHSSYAQYLNTVAVDNDEMMNINP